MVLLSVYLVGGFGIATFALFLGALHNAFEFLSLVLLWPLCAPFLFAGPRRKPGASLEFHQPEQEREVLSSHCRLLQGRLQDIDALLAKEEWNPQYLARKRKDLDPDHASSRTAIESLSVRLEHIERLRLLRNVHADELEEVRSLLDQLNSQEQLSRFLVARDDETLSDLEAIRARVADSESVLASEAELIALCHESL